MKEIYEIMHGEKTVAQIDLQGRCKILEEKFLPYNLYLETEDGDIDTLVNNVTNFYYWCATRILTLDRQYAKEILNSIGVQQAVTDRERAQIALSYHCVSLTDVYWVRKQGEQATFAEINLYDNHLENAFVDVSLRGRQMTVNNQSLTRDLSTNGCFPKAWIRTGNVFQLLKDGGRETVEKEVLASRICGCFDCPQVRYEPGEYDKEPVSVSEIMTSKEQSIVSREYFEIYAQNHEFNPLEYILNLDSHGYYMMNILDYLVGNTDRHWGNWGFMIDNRTNRPISLHPLMDFNQVFQSYDTLEGANCQTVFPEILTQKEAAIAAVRQNGLHQIHQVEREWFAGREKDYEMFTKRLEVLKNAAETVETV